MKWLTASLLLLWLASAAFAGGLRPSGGRLAGIAIGEDNKTRVLWVTTSLFAAPTIQVETVDGNGVCSIGQPEPYPRGWYPIGIGVGPQDDVVVCSVHGQYPPDTIAIDHFNDAGNHTFTVNISPRNASFNPAQFFNHIVMGGVDKNDVVWLIEQGPLDASNTTQGFWLSGYASGTGQPVTKGVRTTGQKTLPAAAPVGNNREAMIFWYPNRDVEEASIPNTGFITTLSGWESDGRIDARSLNTTEYHPVGLSGTPLPGFQMALAGVRTDDLTGATIYDSQFYDYDETTEQNHPYHVGSSTYLAAAIAACSYGGDGNIRVAFFNELSGQMALFGYQRATWAFLGGVDPL